MKKGLSVLLFLLISATLIFAQATTEQKVVAKEKITLRYQDWRLTEEPSGSILKEIIGEYQTMHPNITVEIEPIPAGERDRMFIIQSEGGDAPDIVRVMPGSLPNFVEKGYVLPIDALASKEQGFFDKWAPHLLKAGEWKGKAYGIPSEGDVYILYVNKELYQKAGLDPYKPATTWNEWLSDMKKIADPKNKIYGTAIQAMKATSPPLFLQTFFLANGANFFNEDYTEVIMDSPEGIAAFKFFIELYTVHNLIPNPTEVGYNEMTMMFANGNVASMMLHGIGRGVIEAKNPTIKDKMISVPFPGKTNAIAGRGTLYALSSKTKHAEAAWDLVRYITSKENQLKFWHQGKTFPALLEALGDPAIADDPVAKTVLDETPNGVNAPLTPVWPEVCNLLMTAIQEAYLKVKTPEQALRDAAAASRVVLSKTNAK